MDVMNLAAKISLDSKGFEQGLRDTESKAKAFGDKLSAWTVAKGQMLADLAKKCASSVTDFVKGAVDEGAQFDKSMSQVAATMGKSVEELENEVGSVDTKYGHFTGNLREYARFMGENTAFSAKEAADALNYMALAGYTVDQSLKMLPNVLNLAAAGNMDLATASDRVTDAQSALGLTAEETTELVDKMAMTASKTNTSVAQLSEGILQIGGTAKQLRGGTTELNALLGALANSGMKGAEGGTLLRNVLKNLTAPTKQAAAEMKKLGLNVYDAQGNLRSVPEIMKDLNGILAGKSDRERNQILNKLFDTRNLKAVTALLGMTEEEWKQLFNDIDGSAGAAQKMADTQLDNLTGDTTKFKSALGELKIMLSDKLSPTLRKFVQFGTKTMSNFTKMLKTYGFKTALKFLKRDLDVGIASLKFSANPTLHKLGVILQTASKAFDILKLSFKDFPKAVTQARDLVKEVSGKAKIKLAEMLGIEDTDEATWGDIARTAITKIKEGFKKALGRTKVALANLLGLTDADGNVVDEETDVSWGNVASAAFKKIKTKFKSTADAEKVRIANWLGMTDDSGNAIDDASDTSWFKVAQAAFKKFKEKFKNAAKTAKIKLANWLGLTDASGNAVDDADDTSWDNIAAKLKEKLTAGFGKLKITLAGLLGITSENGADGVSWEEIGRDILNRMTSYFSHKGDFLKKLILGDEYSDGSGGKAKSTWTDVGKKISAWVTEAFQEGGLLDALLGNAGEKAAAIASFAGDLVIGIANWISQNVDTVVGIITTIAEALGRAAGPVIQALSKILTDPSLWTALAGAIEEVLKALLKVVFPQLFPDEETNQETPKGQRKLHGNALTADEINELAEWRKLTKEHPNASVLDEKGNAMTATEAFEREFRTVLGSRGYSPEAIDKLWQEVKWSTDESFKEIMTDLANASTAFTDQFATDSSGISSSSVDLSGNLVSLSDAAIIAAKNLGAINVNGSHAKGDWNVPYDDYVARLHRGEMVLTASQARRYRDGEGTGSLDYSTLFGGIVRAVKEGMADAHVDAYMDGRKVTKETNRFNTNDLLAARFRP